MLQVKTDGERLRFGEAVTVRFMRTLRIPDDGKDYPLPPGLGEFPIYRVDDYADRVPETWRRHGGVFIPMYQREAMWLSFSARWWKPNAVKVGVGKINAVSGRPWNEGLCGRPQDYIVCPDQPWLDGIHAGKGFIKQFVAMPLGMGYTVEGQMTGKEEFGGVQFKVFEPKPGRFPDEPPEPVHREDAVAYSAPSSVSCDMGIGTGGRMRQKVYRDTYGIDTWDTTNTGRVFVHIVNSQAFREITGHEAPPSPISARYYTEAGMPWFSLYDEHKAGLEAGAFDDVQSVKEMDQQHGFASQQDDASIDVPGHQVVSCHQEDPDAVRDADW